MKVTIVKTSGYRMVVAENCVALTLVRGRDYYPDDLFTECLCADGVQISLMSLDVVRVEVE